MLDVYFGALALSLNMSFCIAAIFTSRCLSKVFISFLITPEINSIEGALNFTLSTSFLRVVKSSIFAAAVACSGITDSFSSICR